MYVHVGAPLTNSPPPKKKEQSIVFVHLVKVHLKVWPGPNKDDQDQGSPIGGA